MAGPCWWSYFGVHAGDRVLTHRLFPILVGSIAYAHQFGAKNHLFSVFLQLWIAKIANTMVFHHFSWRTPSFFHHFFHGPLVYDPSNTENIGFDKKKNQSEEKEQTRKPNSRKKTKRKQHANNEMFFWWFCFWLLFFSKINFLCSTRDYNPCFFKKKHPRPSAKPAQNLKLRSQRWCSSERPSFWLSLRVFAGKIMENLINGGSSL